MLYAAPIWSHAMATPAYSHGLHAAHRLAALRICCAFKSVSDQAALVIAGTPPLDLLAEERAFTHAQGAGRVLCGHGCFRSYLQRFGYEALGTCSCCPGDVEESKEHLIFWCVRFVRERTELEAKMSSTIRVKSLVRLMLTSEENRQAVSSFAASIMTKLRTEERIRNQVAT
ncbi:hypothetical protein KR054_009055 [Drosophila jambulina]|nr:hypothetical protein KR054_009055 [Drosophila jambulina]